MVIYKDKYIFYSVRTLICQQPPKLVLMDSDKGLVLTASASLINETTQMSILIIQEIAGATTKLRCTKN